MSVHPVPQDARVHVALLGGFRLHRFVHGFRPALDPWAHVLAAPGHFGHVVGRYPHPLRQLTHAHVRLPYTGTDTCLLTAGPSVCYARYMSVSDQELLHHLSRMPFADTAELAMITGEAHVAVHRGLAGLLDDGIAGRVSRGTAHLPPSRRYYLTRKGIAQAADALGFDTPSDYVRAYPASREWLTLLIRRMDAVATVYRLAGPCPPGPTGCGRRWNFTGGAGSTPPSPATTGEASAWCARVRR